MNYLKRIFILSVWLASTPLAVRAQTNLDYFFKDSSDYENILVEEVRSADRFVIRNRQNEKESIKMIGLGAPKAPKTKPVDVERDQYGFPVREESAPESSLEEQALTFAKELLEHKKIRLEFDSTKKDDENNTLAYVFLVEGNIFANAEILRQGMAELQIRPPNTKYKNELRQAYQEARKEKRGLQGQ
jgi:micrococcal nuclease